MTGEKLTKAAVAKTVHTPTRDHTGALRLDRTFTPEEAAAVDAANAKEHVESRKTRFTRRRVTG